MVQKYSFVTTPHTMLKVNFPNMSNIRNQRATPVTAYHPEATGIAEAKGKALKLLLQSLVKKAYKKWDQFLPFTVFAFNIS